MATAHGSAVSSHRPQRWRARFRSASPKRAEVSHSSGAAGERHSCLREAAARIAFSLRESELFTGRLRRAAQNLKNRRSGQAQSMHDDYAILLGEDAVLKRLYSQPS